MKRSKRRELGWYGCGEIEDFEVKCQLLLGDTPQIRTEVEEDFDDWLANQCIQGGYRPLEVSVDWSVEGGITTATFAGRLMQEFGEA